MFTEKRGGGVEARHRQRQEQEKKCTLAITVLGTAGRQVLNSQLTLHLCVL